MLGVADAHHRLDELVLLEEALRDRCGLAVCPPLGVALEATRDEDVLGPCGCERTLQAQAGGTGGYQHESASSVHP